MEIGYVLNENGGVMEAHKSVFLPTGLTFQEFDAVLEIMDEWSPEKTSELEESLRSFACTHGITVSTEDKVRDLQFIEGVNIFVEWETVRKNIRKNRHFQLIHDSITMVMRDRCFEPKEEIEAKKVQEFQEQNTAQ